MTEIEEAVVVAEAPPVLKAPRKLKDAISKKNKISSCDCEEGPTKVPFLLFAPPPFNTFEGERCDKCMTILSYKAVEYTKNKEGKYLAAYEIVRIAQGKKPENVEFTCRFKMDEGFNVEMVSVAEKVAKALANPASVVAKYAILEFEGFTSEGMPKKSRVITVRPKADVSVAIEEAKKKQVEIKVEAKKK